MDKQTVEEVLTSPESNFWKCNRIKSYKYWPYADDEICNAEKMAEAGFVAIGGENEPDLVECFICGKQLDGWEAHDDPWHEHKKHQANCEFIKVNKPDESKWTLKEYYTLLKESKKLNFARQIEDALQKAKIAHQEAIDKIHLCFQEKKD